jgi:hypothetical protein
MPYRVRRLYHGWQGRLQIIALDLDAGFEKRIAAIRQDIAQDRRIGSNCCTLDANVDPQAILDRLGIKPLYWANFDDRVLFGSELKAARYRSPENPIIGSRDQLGKIIGCSAGSTHRKL